jgi:multidrug resistance efflux pump
LANAKLKLTQDRVKIYEKMIENLLIRAPFDGKISQVFKSPGTITDTVKPILLLEKNQDIKTVIAYLTQEEIIHIGMGSNIKIYIPASGDVFHGIVTEVDRTNGFIDAINQQYRWRDFQIDRSALVTVSIDSKDYKKFNEKVKSGFPAIVYFKRKFTIF